FELVAGARPSRREGQGRAQLEDEIVNDEPPLASSMAADRQQARALRGDLDAILVKALSKNPERRYQTASAFADDLLRYLDGRPVGARRRSQIYRARRFVARNRVGIAVGAAVVCALVAGTGVALWQARIAAQQRDLALASMRHREAVDHFMSDLLLEAG